MSVFNRSSHAQNIRYTSLAGGICNVVNMLMAFAYRTVFIRLLSVHYLGINGLFTNLLGILSLAELGITSAITFRFYKPISNGDTKRVGELMVLYKWIYRAVAITVLLLGISLYPFLNSLILDASEIPADVDLHIIYLLYLANTAASYLFVYKLTLLNADQRGYIRSIVESSVRALIYVLQIISLVLWRNYTVTLIVAICATILQNMLFSFWVTSRYPAVFAVKTLPEQPERQAVYHDMFAGGCHRLGAVVLTSTDNLVLTRFAGLAAAGLYANYALILTMLKTLLLQLMGSSTASFGSARTELSDLQNQKLYRQMLTINLSLSGFAAFCLFGLTNDFIRIWLGEALLLDQTVVAALCIQFFLDTGRFVTDSYTYGCGLFVKDRIRPLIETVINLVISVILVIKWGIIGVFIGTIVSFLLTAFWRAPYILCHDGLHCGTGFYWRKYALHAVLTVLCCAVASMIPVPAATNWLQWMLKAGFTGCFYLLMLLVVLATTGEGRELMKSMLKKWT